MAIGIATVSCLTVCAGLCAPRMASAQAADAKIDAKMDQPVTLNFESGQIQTVLKALFSNVGANYSIDSEVSGTVSINMSNVSFLAALRSILHANNPPLTYDYTDGVYHIRVRKQAATIQPVVSVDSGGGDTPGGGGTTTSGSESATPNRYYHIPIDHYDVAALVKYLSLGKGVTVVPATGLSGGAGAGTGAGGAMGVSNTGGAGGVGGSGMGMSSGMGGGAGIYHG